MKLAVISDIHGNLEALNEVLADIDRGEISRIICLGDMIGYGPEPEAVVDIIRRRNIPCVMGNHELALLNPGNLARMNQRPRESLLISRRLLSVASIDYIKTLRPALSLYDCLFVHGCPPASVTTYLFDLDKAGLESAFGGWRQNLCFCGHTHDLKLIGNTGSDIRQNSLDRGSHALKKGWRYIVNAGSVGQPRDGNNNAKYLLWDPGARIIEVRFVPYDIKKTAALIMARGLPEFNASRLW